MSETQHPVPQILPVAPTNLTEAVPNTDSGEVSTTLPREHEARARAPIEETIHNVSSSSDVDDTPAPVAL